MILAWRMCRCGTDFDPVSTPLKKSAMSKGLLRSGLLSTVTGGWVEAALADETSARDPEPGASSTAMTGACLTVSQVQSIPWSAAPSSTALLLVTSAFVTPIVTKGIAAKPYAMRAAAVVGAPVSFLEKETGERLGQNVGRASSLLQG